MEEHTKAIQGEFTRVASTFGKRTAGRFDAMGIVEFSRVEPGSKVLEVGAGTGNFLSLFEPVAKKVYGVDLTDAMLRQAQQKVPSIAAIVADGAKLPLSDGSMDLATTAQTIHHIPEPVAVIAELARVAGSEGKVLVVDQVATESAEESEAMTELETVRDPTHATSWPPSAFRRMIADAGLEMIDEKSTQGTDYVAKWMSPDEYSPERIAAVMKFIAERGDETGMGFVRSPDGEWTYTRIRIMLLARPSS